MAVGVVGVREKTICSNCGNVLTKLKAVFVPLFTPTRPFFHFFQSQHCVSYALESFANEGCVACLAQLPKPSNK